MRTLTALFILTISTWTSTAYANDNVVLNPYVSWPTYTPCDDTVELEATACPDLHSDPQVGLAFVWVLLSFVEGPPEGVSEVRFGLDYESQSQGWIMCEGVSEDPESGWPNPGTGNRVFWEDGCYRSEGCTIRLGLIVNDGTGEFRITADPRVGQANWTNCDGEVDEVEPFALGGAFDLANGTDPNCIWSDGGGYCTLLPTPVQTTSWSRIHSLFR